MEYIYTDHMTYEQVKNQLWEMGVSMIYVSDAVAIGEDSVRELHHRKMIELDLGEWWE